MRILVTNNTLDFPGGSETYALALATELVRQGYQVYAWGTRIGKIGRQMAANGVSVHRHIPRENFDLILASHTSTVNKVKGKGRLIQTCHGTIHKLEQPVSAADLHVSISEEVQEHVQKKVPYSPLIRNGVDCERFAPDVFREKPRKALVLSRNSKYRNWLKGVLKKKDIEVIVRDKLGNPSMTIEHDMRTADLVFSLGRGAYEAMACGKVVFCLDNREYMPGGAIGEGILTADSIDKAVTCNCSGRATNSTFDEQGILDEIDKHYTHNTAAFSRSFILDNMNIRSVVKEYIDLR